MVLKIVETLSPACAENLRTMAHQPVAISH